MDRKKFLTNIGRSFGYAGLICSSLICRMLPLRLIYWIGNSFAFLGYRLAKKQREIALESLTIAFGREKTAAEIKKIAQDCFGFIGKSGLELVYLMEKPRLLKRLVTIEGKEHLDKALEKGKGVILISAHFGNFPLMLSRLSLEGYSVFGVMKYMRDERAENLFYQKRSRMGIKTIYTKPLKECTENCLKALRSNGLLFLLIDQNFGSGGGVFVDFFGQKAATAPGPVVLAMRTHAAIMPCFIVRQPDDTHKLIFEPAIGLETDKAPGETVTANIQKLTGII
ncbi:MAG: lysophospholipid acyltransferase family protein, partial [Candidatus Omnitrophica bacterium]|nr:lysophospholipid acyltransferase family protein [Candidatus Omnitrophota bacterium]